MKCRISRKVVLLLLTAAMLTFILNTEPAIADHPWWDSNWTYRREIIINEESGYSLTSFPVEVAFQHNGKAHSSGDDIRVIVDGAEILSHVSNINSTHVKVVFEISLAALETKFVHVYYGNPSVVAPSYPLVPLTISEGNTGYAIIDNSVYLGWDYTSWGWSNNVELWNDFRIDFNGNNDPTDDNDVIRDYSSRQGGIARHRADVQAIGLGEYQDYVQTPIYVDINFVDAVLRVYRNHPWVETTQADFLFMFSTSYTHAKYGGGTEQNIVDGIGTNRPELWNVLYLSKENPHWMAFRDSSSGEVFASTGFRIGSDYAYVQSAKEMSDWDRVIDYSNRTRDDPLDPYDQPPDCRIYWYGDNTNGYSSIDKTANILNNQPSTTVGEEETGIISKTLSIKLSGDFDYASKEKIKVKLAALVKDADTMEAVSDANVTVDIYHPNGTLWVSDNMTENQHGTGIYEWQSSETIYQMNIEDDIYLVHVKASVGDGPVATDMLLFHIDPPSDSSTFSSTPLIYYVTAVALITAGTLTGIALLRRYRKIQLVPK